MSWSAQQDEALKGVTAWLKAKNRAPVMRLFGYAGTGKTTMAKEIAVMVKGTVLFATYTGKASLVLRSKGCENTSTIHSLIYRCVQDDYTGQHRFVLNPESALSRAKLLIIDECSMVDKVVGADLMKFDVPILVLGDPAQLPPVSGAGFFTNHDPDFMLTEVHRQARDNPIIRLSMDVRQGIPLEYGNYSDSSVIRWSEREPGMLSSADQVLAGLNKSRVHLNKRLREARGITSETPVIGDRLVCLKNKAEKSLLNGGLWEVVSEPDVDDLRDPPSVEMRVKSIDEGGPKYPVPVIVPEAFFQGKGHQMDWKVMRAFDSFDYGYCLTVHKSQGSQWDNVVVIDESSSFGEDRHRWLYTAITRAAERVTVIQ